MKAGSGGDGDMWTQYNTLERIYEWLDEQIKKNPDVLTNYNIGQSYEKRTVRAVKLSLKPVRISISHDCPLSRISFIQLKNTRRATAKFSSSRPSTLASG